MKDIFFAIVIERVKEIKIASILDLARQNRDGKQISTVFIERQQVTAIYCTLSLGHRSFLMNE